MDMLEGLCLAMLVRHPMQVIRTTLCVCGRGGGIHIYIYTSNKILKCIQYAHTYLDTVGEAVRAIRDPMDVPDSSLSSAAFSSGWEG